MSKYAVIIGRFEHVDIMEKAESVPAKIDTGAYRSAIHATDIEIISDKKGAKVLRFNILGHPVYRQSMQMETKQFNIRKVRNSTGHTSDRYEITLRIKLGYKIFRASFTLVDRSNNVFPVLIGRKVLNKRFIVDTDKSGVNRKELKVAAEQVPGDLEYLEGVPR